MTKLFLRIFSRKELKRNPWRPFTKYFVYSSCSHISFLKPFSLTSEHARSKKAARTTERAHKTRRSHTYTRLRACAHETNAAHIRSQERAHTRQEEATRTLAKSVCTEDKHRTIRAHTRQEEATRTLVSRACAQETRGDTYKMTGRNRYCTPAAVVAQQHGYGTQSCSTWHNVESTLEPMVLRT